MHGHDFYPRSVELGSHGSAIRKLNLMQMIFMHLITLDSRNFTFLSKHFMKMGDVG